MPLWCCGNRKLSRCRTAREPAMSCKLRDHGWYGYTTWTVLAAVAPDGASLQPIANVNLGADLVFDDRLAIMKFGDFGDSDLGDDAAYGKRRDALQFLFIAALAFVPQ